MDLIKITELLKKRFPSKKSLNDAFQEELGQTLLDYFTFPLYLYINFDLEKSIWTSSVQIIEQYPKAGRSKHKLDNFNSLFCANIKIRIDMELTIGKIDVPATMFDLDRTSANTKIVENIKPSYHYNTFLEDAGFRKCDNTHDQQSLYYVSFSEELFFQTIERILHYTRKDTLKKITDFYD
jgi:hypothetical protein